MKEHERIELIEYRLRQALEHVEISRFQIENEQWATAVNRIYYGLYHALTALALKYEYKTSHHAQLIGWFNREFVATSRVETSIGKFLKEAYKNRMKGDYDAFVSFEKQQVEEMIPAMEQFIDAIKHLVTV